MTRLVFGSLAADMTDLQRFGFASYFSGLSPVVTSLSTTLVTARDPGTGTTMAAQGGFDLGTANHASVVTGFSATTAAGQPLFNWTVLNATYTMVQPILTTPGNFQTLFTALLNGADDITGSGAADVLQGREGNDSLNGGAGDDTAVYSGPRGSFTVSRVGAGWQVAARSGAEGTDTLQSVEALRFADQQLALVEPDPPGGTPAPAYRQSGSFLFDPVYYLLTNPGLVPTVSMAAAPRHYLDTGAAAGRAPNAWFDADYYEARWPDLATLGLDDATLFQHFNLYGVWEGRSPGPRFQRFDGDRYLGENPDVAAYVDAHLPDFLGSRTNGAIAHFLIYGADEQRAVFETTGSPIDLGYIA